MAQPTVDVGTGASLVFTITSFTAEISEFTPGTITRPSIDITHLGSTPARVFMPGDLYDPGELEAKIHYNPDSKPPFTGAKEVVQIKYPTSGTITTGSNDKVDMFVTEFNPGTVGVDELMEATVKLKCSGAITHSNAA